MARTGLAAALGILIFLVLSSVESQATPIKPDVQKLLRQSQQTQKPFIPARAGWNEPTSAATVVRNPVLESVAGDHMRQEFRETLTAVATPDPWIVLALATLVLLMRKLRSIEAQRNRVPRVAVLAKPAEPPARLAA